MDLRPEGIFRITVSNAQVTVTDEKGTTVPDETARNIARLILSDYRVDRPCYLYLGQDKNAPHRYKIGISANPEKRLKTLQANLIWSLWCGSESRARMIEWETHCYLKGLGKREKGEWFLLSENDIQTLTVHSSHEPFYAFLIREHKVLTKQIAEEFKAQRSIGLMHQAQQMERKD